MTTSYGASGHTISEERRYRQAEKILYWPMMVLAIVFLLVILLPLQQNVPEIYLEIGAILEVVIWAVFVAEFLLLLILAPDKSDYLSGHVIEMLALLLPALRVFRLFRVLRLLRLLRAGRTPLLVLASIRNLRRGRLLFKRFRLGYLLLTAAVLLLSGAGIVYLSEGGAQFGSYPRCLWWCVFTLVSTSYDLGFPQTRMGNIVGIIIMLLGLALMGVFTAIVASVFVELHQEEERGRRPRHRKRSQAAITRSQPIKPRAPRRGC